MRNVSYRQDVAGNLSHSMLRYFIIILGLIFSLNLKGQEIDCTDSTNVYLIVDKMPTFQNGEEILKGFPLRFARSFQYPDSIDCLITKIVIDFIIDEKGDICCENFTFPYSQNDCQEDIKIIEERLYKFIYSLPRFIPGQLKGVNVKTRLRIPIIIDLQ